jgi:hypothetical protein
LIYQWFIGCDTLVMTGEKLLAENSARAGQVIHVGEFSAPGELRTIVIAMCLAFQNRFFWQTTLATRVQQDPPVVNEQQ